MKNFLLSTPIAHRGLHDTEKPENSLPAFEAAIRLGYPIETDVRFTKDKKLVVFHDDTLLRMTGDPRAVSDCALEELSPLLLDGKEHIPTFEEFLHCIAGRTPLLIEIKSMDGVKGKEIASALSYALANYAGEYAIQSFQPLYVKAYKKLCPSIPCGVLATAKLNKEAFGNSPLWRIKAYIVRNLALNFTVRPDFVSYDFSGLPKRRVTKFKGIKLGWTVRSKDDEAQAKKFVDNIIFENFLPRK